MQTTRLDRSRILVLALAAGLAALSFGGCSKAKESAEEAQRKAKEAGAAVKDSAASMTEVAKQKAAELSAEAKKTSGEMVATAEQKGAEAVAAVEAKAGELGKDADAKRATLVRDLQHRLGTIDTGIVTLEQRVSTAKDGAKVELEQSLAKLRTQRTELRDRMQRLSASSGAAWDDLATGTRSAVDDLEQAIQRALARFK